MKNTIKLLAAIMAIFAASETFAQTYRVKGGLNLSTMRFDGADQSGSDTKLLPGFQLGATTEFHASEQFSFETGLLFTTKGFRYKEKGTESDFGTTDYKFNYNLYYLEIPLNAKLTFDVGNIKMYGTFGPYLGVGLFGNAKLRMTSEGETIRLSEPVKFGKDEDLSRFDLGLSAGFGVEIKAFQIGLSYGYGLTNLATYKEDGFSAANRVLSLTCGYKFAGK